MITFIKHFWSEILRVATFIIVALLLIFALTAYIAGQKVQNSFLLQTTQNTEEIKAQSNEIKQLAEQNKQLSEQNKTLAQENQTQQTCLFSLFVDFINNHTQLTKANVQSCQVIIQSSSPGGTTGSTKSVPMTSPTPPAQTTAPAQNNGQGNTTHPQPSPKPKPVKSLVCKVTLGLVGCK